LNIDLSNIRGIIVDILMLYYSVSEMLNISPISLKIDRSKKFNKKPIKIAKEQLFHG